jgi:3-methylfumaryl-CoA hydratase
MTVSATDVEAWRGWIGRTETRRQRLDPEIARRYAAAVGSDLDIERVFPPLGHWAYFVDVAGPDGLGPDGHPKRGGDGLMPPITLPRRMFAAGALEFVEPLALGQDAELTLTIADVRHRAGRSGDLVFVEVDRTLTQNSRPRILERQTIVYRDAGEPTPPVVPASDAPTGDETWTPTTADLFRFSAATFNSHRIHYDLPYATKEEGYPGLVVQGPFTAAKLFAFVAARDPIRRFSFQAKAPLFASWPVRLLSIAPGAAAAAVRCDGETAMSVIVGATESQK